jgi:hypothetical protein
MFLNDNWRAVVNVQFVVVIQISYEALLCVENYKHGYDTKLWVKAICFDSSSALGTGPDGNHAQRQNTELCDY